MGFRRKFTGKGDLVVCELNRTVRLYPKGMGISFTTPQSIKQVLDGIEQPVDEIFAGFERHIRSRIRRLESHGYDVTITHSEADFDLFYHRMLPYVEARHAGRSALMGSYDYIRDFFAKGTLFILKQDEEPVSGAICKLIGSSCSGTHMEVIDGRVGPVQNVKETDLAHRLKTLAQFGLAGIVMISPSGEKSLVSTMVSTPYQPSSHHVESAPSQ